MRHIAGEDEKLSGRLLHYFIIDYERPLAFQSQIQFDAGLDVQFMTMRTQKIVTQINGEIFEPFRYGIVPSWRFIDE
jgi:hypothetical protein